MKRCIVLFMSMVLCVSMLSGCTSIVKKGAELVYEMADRYTVGDAEITEAINKIEINWVTGSVHIVSEKRDTIAFSEKANEPLKDDLKLRYLVSGGKLTIQFCISGKISVGENFDLKKDLTIYIPEDLNLDLIQVDTVSSDVEITGATCDKILVAGVSADADITETEIAKSLQFETISGDLNYYCKGTQLPEEISIDSVSGNANLTLFEGASIEVDLSSVSGKLQSDLSYDEEGATEIEMDSVSGNLTLLK